jgi:hypothetical protein
MKKGAGCYPIGNDHAVRQLNDNRVVAETFFTTETNEPRVEVGSNTSTVTLRVVGGDEKGSLKSETVKYGRKSQGTKTRENCAGKGQRHVQKTDPSSRQRGRPTESRT